MGMAARRDYQRGAATVKTVNLLRSLLPHTSYDSSGRYLTAELTAEANALDNARTSAGDVTNSVTPFYATMTLADWERVYEIAVRDGATLQERRDNVIIKMAATGGLSKPYFINLAASLGYTITISEPGAFHAGINRCGDRLYMAEIQWVWIVTVHGAKTPRYRFRAGSSAAGEPLLSFGELTLEKVFQDLKPAWTWCEFGYEDEY